MEKKPLGNFLISILVKGCESESDTEPESDQVFVAFARVMSGVVKRGQKLYVLGPKHDPEIALTQVSVEIYNY
jgi:ribosome assembly protein 1